MNSIKHAIAAKHQLASSRLSRRNYPVIRHPIAALQRSSLYSTAAAAAAERTDKLKNQRQQGNNSKNPNSQRQAEQSSSSSEVSLDWPRPSQIPWQARVANSVNLIGRVQIPVQFQASPDGKYWAGTIIAQQDANSSSHTPPSFRIPVTFEGDLAHIAACHLKEKDWVYIAGQLSAEPPPYDLSQGQANLQVMVHSINFVQGSSQPKTSVIPCNQEQWVINQSASTTKDGDPALSSWRDLLKNPKQWCDYRENKLKGLVKAKHPDFKQKNSGLALWLNVAPQWVFPGLKGLEFDVPVHKMKQAQDHKEDDSWKNLVENPGKWWDNRSNKRNEKSPDFKHKDTGKGLWLSDSPAWALSRLPPLKAKQNVATWKKNTLPSETMIKVGFCI